MDEYLVVLSDYNSVFDYYLENLAFCGFCEFGFYCVKSEAFV